jgi:SAM-dependent methyltransferase
MQVSESSQTSLESPFDAVASSYDSEFTDSRLGRWLRQLVWHHLETAFQPGVHVLELGCGTGEDAIWLARRGFKVTATDASTEMLARARQRAGAEGLMEAIRFFQWDLGALDPSGLPPQPTDGYGVVFSNFGALNCLSDRGHLAELLAGWLQPGGKAVFVVMGPWCPWEIAWHLTHGQVRTAFRRLRKGAGAHIGQGRSVRVWYPSPGRLRREFSAYFRSLKVAGIGAFLPPSYLYQIVERFPQFFAGVKTLDLKLGHLFPLNWLNDHYLIVMERR